MEKWWNEICGRGKWEKPREKPTQTSFRPPRNPHGVTETRTGDPSGGRRASNRLRHEAAFVQFCQSGSCVLRMCEVLLFPWFVIHTKLERPLKKLLFHMCSTIQNGRGYMIDFRGHLKFANDGEQFEHENQFPCLYQRKSKTSREFKKKLTFQFIYLFSRFHNVLQHLPAPN